MIRTPSTTIDGSLSRSRPRGTQPRRTNPQREACRPPPRPSGRRGRNCSRRRSAPAARPPSRVRSAARGETLGGSPRCPLDDRGLRSGASPRASGVPFLGEDRRGARRGPGPLSAQLLGLEALGELRPRLGLPGEGEDPPNHQSARRVDREPRAVDDVAPGNPGDRAAGGPGDEDVVGVRDRDLAAGLCITEVLARSLLEDVSRDGAVRAREPDAGVGRQAGGIVRPVVVAADRDVRAAIRMVPGRRSAFRNR